MGNEGDAGQAQATAAQQDKQDAPATLLTGTGPADQKAAAQEPAAKEPAAPAKDDEAPATAEGYTLSFAKDTQVDGELLGAFKATAHELGLTNKQAQSLAKTYEAQMKAAGEKAEEAQAAAVEEARKYWEGKCRELPDFPAKLNDARRALAEFGDEELFNLLNTSLLGNHPKVLECFAKIGKALGEPGIRAGQGPAGEVAVDAAEMLYPNM